MSRWSADSLRIVLMPGEIALARGARQLARPAGRETASLLNVLDETLADTAWRAPRVEVVLSQSLVRQVLTPPPKRLLPAAEERALVLASLRAIYGELAANWTVQVVSQPPHAGLVGAALDAGFLTALETLLARHGSRQLAIRPLASLAARHAPARLDGWWVLVEPSWLSLFGGSRGVWQHVAGLPIDTDSLASLPELLARERASAPESIPHAAWLHPLGLGQIDLGQIVAAHDARLRWQVLPHNSRLTGVAALLEA